jgi:hypothetical protein
MNGNIGAGGDSGGGWSFNYTAYGGHHGPCGTGGDDAFSVADYFDEALNVRVLIFE